MFSPTKACYRSQTSDHEQERTLMYCLWDVWAIYEISCRAQEASEGT